MTLDHAVDPSAEAARYVDAVARVCDHYDVAAESDYVELPDSAERVHYLTASEGPPSCSSTASAPTRPRGFRCSTR